MDADPVLVGKCFLGPRYIELELRGEEQRKQIWKEAWGDLANYNYWYAQRQRGQGDLPGDLSDQVRSAVHQDYRNPQFHERLWHTMLEYERRISEPGKEDGH